MNKLKFIFKLWVCVWMLVTGISFAIISTEIPLPMPVQTMIVSTIMVPTMVFVIIPFLKRPTS